MNEIKSIVEAFRQAQKNGKKAALATVVKVEGSSYRRPGARMLVTEDGQLTGAISGGCLEGDALKKALFAISSGKNKLVTYDTMDEDDIKFGVQLGCNGIVHILFEPLGLTSIHDPIQLLDKLSADRVDTVLLTLFSFDQVAQAGTCALFAKDGLQGFLPPEHIDFLSGDLSNCLNEKHSVIKHYSSGSLSMEALIEFIPPPPALIIAGAGNDVQPLVNMAAALGWHITVVDGRSSHLSPQRFAMADRLMLAKPGKVLEELRPDARTAFLLMSHNYNYDLGLLQELTRIDFSFLGILGPAQKKERMLKELADKGIEFSEQQRTAIYGPVGLDIGAETAEEIALSILAEIKAVFSGGQGGSLSQKNGPIHNRLTHARQQQ